MAHAWQDPAAPCWLSRIRWLGRWSVAAGHAHLGFGGCVRLCRCCREDWCNRSLDVRGQDGVALLPGQVMLELTGDREPGTPAAALSRTAQLVPPGLAIMKRSCPPGALLLPARMRPLSRVAAMISAGISLRVTGRRRRRVPGQGQDAAEDTPEAIWPPWHARYASPEPQGQSSSSATVRAGGNQPAAAEPCA